MPSWADRKAEFHRQMFGTPSGWNDPMLEKGYNDLGSFHFDVPERNILPRLDGPVEDAGAGMATINGLDWDQMTEGERQPYREEAAGMLITRRKEQELAKLAAAEEEAK